MNVYWIFNQLDLSRVREQERIDSPFSPGLPVQRHTFDVHKRTGVMAYLRDTQSTSTLPAGLLSSRHANYEINQQLISRVIGTQPCVSEINTASGDIDTTPREMASLCDHEPESHVKRTTFGTAASSASDVMCMTSTATIKQGKNYSSWIKIASNLEGRLKRHNALLCVIKKTRYEYLCFIWDYAIRRTDILWHLDA